MLTFEGLDENFKFLIIEVLNQIKATREFVASPSRSLFRKITSRDDYIDNLKTVIENKCYSRINIDKDLDKNLLNKIRAIQVSSVNLERIGDYCVNIVKQMAYLEDKAFVNRFECPEAFDIIEETTEKIIGGFIEDDMPLALEICKSEYQLDSLYKDNFNRIMAEMGSGKNIPDLVTVLFIFRYLERIGDSLLNIGEAIIFSILGERIKIEQFESLQQTLSVSGYDGSFSDIDFQGIWGSRSGCRIGHVQAKGKEKEDGPPVAQGSIYKEGNLDKIKLERNNLEIWNNNFPGMVPEVFGFQENTDENKGSMLVEFLPGCTLDTMILTSDDADLENALFTLEQTLRHIWGTTKKDGPLQTTFMEQLKSRRNGVLQVHPEFHRNARQLGTAEIVSSEELINECMAIESLIPAPFTVFIHGDFNCNNVVYTNADERIRFIDLYRSRNFDYIQDASVFMVSSFRMPVFDRPIRNKINSVITRFYNFAEEFAQENNDPTWQARLALALARSFYTSTRFEFNYAFAKEMFNRSMFLLEKVNRYNGKWENFILPEDILHY
ncbi:PhoU domain-containing protein [Maridesulfovibrio hydrothermalis]|uniref:Phosphate uptake regulator, PhoU n=1 Tax=Maridesulfovibrio hydrothermalis AM13 = DSM 14728 TaxID=1121451 RepID=L0RC82_9BACT|nr:PhoU domain-containing protein [Maridesulfovibrio hydrothermalis]CCO23805.1 Phosphate uptake regulator, PhoU [Maridesulfovibrio hydrothermalis AM13 = DSM 14728]